MLIYCLVDILIVFYAIFGNVNSTKKRKKLFLIIAFGLLTIIAMLRKYTIGIDLEILYVPKFIQISKCSFFELLNIKLELGYVFFCKLLSLITDDYQILIVVSSIITIPIYAVFIYRNSKDVAMSTTLYIFLNLFFMSMNIVRQELAVAIILIAYEYLMKDENIKFIVLVGIATFFHASAIICLSFILLKKIKFTKKVLLISIIVLLTLMMFYRPIITIFSNFSNMIGIDNNKDYSMYLENEKYGVGIINLNSISTSILSTAIYLLAYYYLIVLWDTKLDKKINFWMFATMIYCIITVLSLKMVIIGRLSYYFIPFILLIIPESIHKSKILFNKFLVSMLLYGTVIVKYIYILIFLADVLYGVMPYEFFWN